MGFSTKTLTDLRTDVRVILQDAGALNFTDDEVDAGLRRALNDLGSKSPLMTVAVLTLLENGGELTLSDYAADLPGLPSGRVVIDAVFWPYDPNYPRQVQANRVSGYFVEPDGDDAQLVIIPVFNGPLTGEKVRLRYGKGRAVNGLDGATATTVFEHEVTPLVSAAAGYTALGGTVDRADDIAAELIHFARALLNQWRADLASMSVANLSQQPLPSDGWGDAWDQPGA